MKVYDLFETLRILNESAEYRSMYEKYEEKYAKRVDLRVSPMSPSKVERTVRHIFKKRDRVVWFMRLYILFWLQAVLVAAIRKNLEQDVAEIAADIETFIDKYNRKTRGERIRYKINTRSAQDALSIYSPASLFYWRGMNLPAMMSVFEHFFSLPIPAIQDRVFGWDIPSDVLDEFEEAEQEWKAARERFVELSPDQKIILEFPDGYAWVDLGKASCEAEADAMGHCGNEPQARNPDQTIFSLRKKVMERGKQVGWEPALTFIYHKREKGFGEMKGRGNDKPASRYHKYIIPLLELPIVERLIGGGYKPENNFALSDLPKPEAQRLLKKKPGLGKLMDLVELGMEAEVVKIITDMVSEVKDDMRVKNGKLIWRYDESVYEIAKNHLGVDLDEHVDFSLPDSYLEGYLTGENHVDVLKPGDEKKIVSHYQKFDEEIEDMEGVLRFLKDNDWDRHREILMQILYQEEQAYQDFLYTTVEKIVGDVDNIILKLEVSYYHHIELHDFAMGLVSTGDGPTPEFEFDIMKMMKEIRNEEPDYDPEEDYFSFVVDWDRAKRQLHNSLDTRYNNYGWDKLDGEYYREMMDLLMGYKG